ncbi:MAG: site-2 protease family protein [Armatimonadetes bacterium]|nr:site-2 protease family protein [Armatimonadota bacterium]
MTFRLGRIWGLPIEIDATWFIIFALVTWSLSAGYFPRLFPEQPATLNWLLGAVAALLLFASVLVHELAHSYVAMRNGLDIGGITLFLFGGVSKMTQEPGTPDLELKMAAAGPATSVLLGGLFWVIAQGLLAADAPVQIAAVAGYLAFINVILAVFNLVPGFPLDGGRVLRALLWRATGSLERATRYASYGGQGFGYLLMFLGFLWVLSGALVAGVWFIIIGWFLAGAAQSAYQQVIVRRALSGVPVERIMQRDVPRVACDTPLRDLVDEYFMRYDYSAYPVVEGEDLVGIVTVDDVREVPREEWAGTAVRQVVRPPDEHRLIDEKDDAWDALMQMAQLGARRLLVVHDGHLEGIVSRDSVLQVVRHKMQFEQGGDTPWQRSA